VNRGAERYFVAGNLIVAGPTCGKTTLAARLGAVDTDDIISKAYGWAKWRKMNDSAKAKASETIAAIARAADGYIFTNLWYPQFLRALNGANMGEVYVYRDNPERVLELLTDRGSTWTRTQLDLIAGWISNADAQAGAVFSHVIVLQDDEYLDDVIYLDDVFY